MRIQTRLTLVIFTIFLIGWIVAGISALALENINARQNIIRTAEVILKTARAAGDYTGQQIEPLLAKQNMAEPKLIKSKAGEANSNDFIRETVPSYASQEILARLSKEYKGYSYSERALNPTNPQDLAEGWQVEIIKNFIKNPNIQKTIGQRIDLNQEEIFYIAQPIKVDSPSCLKCHSTPDIAPASLIKSYGSAHGFNWKINEIIGTRIVTVPTYLQQKQARTSIVSYLLIIASVFLIAYAGVIFVVNRWLIKPIDAIAHLVEKVSLEPREGSQLPENYPGSLGKLNRAINRLLISLRKSLIIQNDRSQ